jgi:hypothetical protein
MWTEEQAYYSDYCSTSPPRNALAPEMIKSPRLVRADVALPEVPVPPVTIGSLASVTIAQINLILADDFFTAGHTIAVGALGGRV